jgi:hypothetical protein
MRGKNREIKTIQNIHMTEKSIMVLNRCITLSGEDVTGDYELFKITEQLEQFITHHADREALGLATTLQIIDSIEYLKKEGLLCK